MSRTWSEELGTGWRVAAVVEGVRHEGVVTRLSPEQVTFRDADGESWVVSRAKLEILGPPR